MPLHLLRPDASLARDTTYSAQHVPFEGSKFSSIKLTRPEPFETPDPILLEADLGIISGLDFPVTDLGDTVMSKRAYRIFESFGMPRHRVIPLVMLDDTADSGAVDETGIPRPQANRNEDFVALDILEEPVEIDWAASVVKIKDRSWTDEKSYMFRKIAFVEPPTGYPALFTRQEYNHGLFVTDTLRTALTDAGCTGAYWASDHQTLLA